MSTVGNWIGEITTTIGTGSIELGGPINPSFVKFSDAVVDLSEVWYAIVDGDNRESGLGTLNGANLERTVVHTTLVDGVYLGNTPDPISLSGGAQIYSTFNKAAFDMFYNALVANASDISDLQSAVIALQAADLLKENSLGNPAGDGHILSSTIAGVRSWVPASDADMVSSVYDPTGIYGDAFNRINHHGVQSMSTVSGLSDALNGKVDSSTTTTGTAISFDSSKVYGTVDTPETANITNNLTGAKLGIVQKIYHNHSTAPTFPAGWVKLSGTYKVGVLNIIYCDFSGGSRVEYWVAQ